MDEQASPASYGPLVERLINALSAGSIRTGGDVSDKYRRDWSGVEGPPPAVLVLPHSTSDVSRTLAICHELRCPLVPQGGLTGLTGGAVPVEGAVALSLERMAGIEELDTDSATMTVLAGTPLQIVQQAAVDAGFLCALDLGARGSCHIGGNISTNAGGNRVIRYGMTRDQILGLEVVLPDGTVLPMLDRMIKNNTGPDLKQLFIGGEGILGVVTRAVLRLRPGISGANTALLAVDDFDSVLKLLRHSQHELADRVSAFEMMDRVCYRSVTTHDDIRAPLDGDHAFYLLVDMQGPRPQEDAPRFERVLEHALDQGWIVDAAIAQSTRDAADFWALRDRIGEQPPAPDPVINLDVAVRVADIGHCIEHMREAVRERFPRVLQGYFGHVGDGNVHVAIGPVPRAGNDNDHRIKELIYSIVRDMDGSISAEHGIGLRKRPWLGYSRTPAEIELMRTLKTALDPHALLNPGKIITP